ncbi:MAG: histidine--tRNA ligase [Armatimonadetes bacterium]|nr:histidine--tRNA ligase [Armatimonadota bacterium]
MQYAAPRGTHDIMPDETPLWHWLEEKFRRVTRLYGYQEIRTPVFEHTEVFARTSGESSDIVRKEMYTFEDRSGQSLSLRPEGTAGVVRAYLQNGLNATMPLAKLCYIAPNFRYERPAAARYRQHHQVGIEAIGSQDPALDAEIIGFGRHYLDDVGLTGTALSINSVGCPNCRPAYREALQAFLQPLLPRLSEDSQRRFETNPMRILDSKDEGDRDLTADAPVMLEYLCEECQDHFARLQNHLLDLDIEFEVDRRLVRGLDYYTKTAFEFKHAGLGAQDTVLAGGRYDGFVEQLGGPPTPGIGFGSGMERVLEAMAADGIRPVASGPRPDVFVATMGEAAHKFGVSVLGQLRRDGIASEMSYGSRSLKSQMKQADRSGAQLALLLGDDELSKGAATVRWLQTSEQQFVELDELPRRVKELLDATREAPPVSPAPQE